MELDDETLETLGGRSQWMDRMSPTHGMELTVKGRINTRVKHKRASTSESHRRAVRKYNAKNKEKLREWYKKRYATDAAYRTGALARAREYYEKNKEKINEAKRLERAESANSVEGR